MLKNRRKAIDDALQSLGYSKKCFGNGWYAPGITWYETINAICNYLDIKIIQASPRVVAVKRSSGLPTRAKKEKK